MPRSYCSPFLFYAVAVLAAARAARAQTTERPSLASGGAQGNSDSTTSSISGDGRFVAFRSDASNLVAGDTNGFADIFVHDRQLGTTKRVSVGSGGLQGNSASIQPSISADGRFVVFASQASSLVNNDTNGFLDVFVHDLQFGTTERVSLATGGAQGNSGSYDPSISVDGRFVAFTSSASNLVAGDTNGAADVFVRDRQLGTTWRMSVDSSGLGGNRDSGSTGPSISADGRFVAFDSGATNLVTGDTNGSLDVFVRDRQSGTTERVSVDSTGLEGDSDSGAFGAAISADGRCVAFQSDASNLVAGDTNGTADIFVRDRQSGKTEIVSVDSSAVQGTDDSYFPAISADGRFVAFESAASNLVGGDTNLKWDAFVRDRESGTTEFVSVGPGGAQGNGGSAEASISCEGRFVAFTSSASNLVAGDTNFRWDVFVRDRGASGPGTERCQPGAGGVIACPCSNPPVGLGIGRGCDNKGSTGGAFITGLGSNSLANPTLVFTTADENANATSIMLQGTVLTTGAVFGHGVRCLGSFKRMYTKTAVGGSVTMPDLTTDPTIPVRSATLGNTILVLQKRWYQVYYQDTTQLLTGCPLASSQFNATNVLEVLWLP